MRKQAWAVPLLIAVALTATACSKATGYGSGAGGAYGTSTPASSMPASSGAMSGGVQTAALKVERTSAGMVLAGSKGLTLYYYTDDKPGSGKSVCTGGCATAWPPLTAPVRAPAGAKMPGPIGMITRAGGAKQVTINGYPVYYYAEDMAPGQAKGNGADGSWHVIKLRAAAGSTGMARVSVLKVEHTTAGTVLASRKGLTLYYFTGDKPGSGASACTGTCAKAWPPLAAPVRAPAGAKLPGPIGMITRAGGAKQVTINGYPIYYYAEDMAPGQAKGNGEGGSWHVIKIKMSAAGSGNGGGSGGGGSGGGGGYGY